MSLFDFYDYKTYLISRVKSMPHGGRGEYQKIARYLGIGSVVLSQILKGKRDFSLENGFLVGQYFGFNEFEQDYWQNLILISKSTNLKHKRYIQNKNELIKQKSQELKNIIRAETLSEEAKSIFYSDWHYSAVRLCASIPTMNTIDKIAQHLNLEKSKVQSSVHFLLRYGLLKEEKGVLKRGPVRTQLEADSPFANRYHASWRSKALHNMENIQEHERYLTIPMSLSPKTLSILKEKIGKLTKEVFDTLSDTEITTLGCLNIDLFELKK